MDKQFTKQKYMLYSERKKLADEYEEWVNKPLQDGSKIKDCALSVITFMLIKGFCEIPEGAVVLTEKEYKKLKNGEMTYNQMVRIITEKFAERLKEKMHKGKALHSPVVGKEYVQRIIREVVNEICKEITEGKKE